MKYEPDFNQLLKVLRREKPDRPVLFEFFMGGPVMEKLAGSDFDREMSAEDNVRRLIHAACNGGYDYCMLPAWEFKDMVTFTFGEGHSKKASRSMNEGFSITDDASFEAYPFQAVKPDAYAVLERTASDLPDGMKFMISGKGGIEENMIKLIGYENLCFMQIDEPELVRKVADAVGNCMFAHYREALQYDSLGAIIMNDDWGFRSQTLMPPAFLREYVIPWHRKIAKLAHDAGRSVVLHSCGELKEVWDDIIDDVNVDGKHSYEDAILPVEEAYEKYGSRIAIMGGIDVDFICRKTPEEIYKRCAAIIEQTDGGTGYALGSGNSIAAYVPVEGYEAMTRTALEQR